MDHSALMNAYLNTVLRPTYAPMPYLSMPIFGLPMMPANVISSCPTHHVTTPMPQAPPIVKPLLRKSPFSIDSILEQRMTDAPSPSSTLSTPSAVSTPLSLPAISMTSAYPTPSAQPSSPSPAPPTVKVNVKFTPEIKKILRDWFDAHLDYPYLSEDDVLMLMKKTHLSNRQLRTWFLNRRRSYKQQHGHVKWVKKAAPAYARWTRPAAQQDAAEPAKKMARISTYQSFTYPILNLLSLPH
uniref:Homeobox domain-containing protein n=1 Tax=Panagrellus redivivus TaxID=6233 RepID=A0A7E4WAJ2_PANRE